MKLPLARICQWISATSGDTASLLPPDGGVATGYSIDSRTIAKGELFFAVHGERFDGHDFLTAAFAGGAVAAVISQDRVKSLPRSVLEQELLVVKDDPLAALQRLAMAVRRHWGGRVIGITGSAGKTTTKEAIAAVLGKRFLVLKSEGNLNNGFGMPLQLLRLEPEDEIAVIEMGMSNAGEIAALAKIASPGWGVVTNVGMAHAENFADGISGVARAKYELIAALPPDGVAFLNCGDPYVSQFGRDFRGKTVSFGSGPCAEPHAEDVEELGEQGTRFRVIAGGKSLPVRLSVMGRHNVTNTMAAIAVGIEAGVSLEDCVAAVESLKPGKHRGEVYEIRGSMVIDDSYNSNPEALRSMIQMLATMKASKRILVAGEMLELGQESAELHRRCGEFAAQHNINTVVGVRGNAVFLVEGAHQGGAEALFLQTPESAGEWLLSRLSGGEAVLLKASRGVQLERALAVLHAGDTGKGEEPIA